MLENHWIKKLKLISKGESNIYLSLTYTIFFSLNHPNLAQVVEEENFNRTSYILILIENFGVKPILMAA